MDMDGCMRGRRSQKETQTAQGHRRSTKETRPSVRIAGLRWCQPRAQGLQITQSRCCRRYLRAQGTQGWLRKSGQCNDAREQSQLSQ